MTISILETSTRNNSLLFNKKINNKILTLIIKIDKTFSNLSQLVVTFNQYRITIYRNNKTIDYNNQISSPITTRENSNSFNITKVSLKLKKLT